MLTKFSRVLSNPACIKSLQSTLMRAFTSTLTAAVEKVVKVPLNVTLYSTTNKSLQVFVNHNNKTC